MNIAYVISAHELPSQLVRLVNRLDALNTSFLIHVDKKIDDVTFREMRVGLAMKPNVPFLTRHVFNWGDFGHVVATIIGSGRASHQADPVRLSPPPHRPGLPSSLE